MKVDYDSGADSLLFEFGKFGRDDDVVELSQGECFVWVLDGRPSSIQLLNAKADVAVLDEAAKRFRLDAAELKAAAYAAFHAPDREVTLEVGQRRLGGNAAKAA